MLASLYEGEEMIILDGRCNLVTYAMYDTFFKEKNQYGGWDVHKIMRFSVWKGASIPRDSDSLRREKKFLQIATFTFNLQKMCGFFHTVRLHLLRAILPNPIAADGRSRHIQPIRL